MKNKLIELMAQINDVMENPTAENKLPSNAYFLKNGDILCCQRKNGVSRFPYSCDGLNLWAYSNGVIHAVEGVFNVFHPVHSEHESSVNFFVGIPQTDGTYFPISVLGSGQQLIEPFLVKRYVVYSLSAAYYIADTDFATFAIRVDMSENKEMRFSFACLNKMTENLKIAFTTYFEALLKNGFFDNMWDCNAKQGEFVNKGEFILKRNNWEYHALAIKSKITDATLNDYYHTVSRPDFLIYQNRNVGNAECLKIGKFETETSKIAKMMTPVAAEIMHLEIKANNFARVDYVCRISHNKTEESTLLNYEINPTDIDKSIETTKTAETERMSTLQIKFGKLKDSNVNQNVLNRFLKALQKQVDFCAMGKNYVEDRIGMRDVFQQLEQALIWDPKQAREKIVRAISYIDISGRAPRQFSIVKNRVGSPKMDLSAYIDQGNWIISTIYTYLAHTADYSILDEQAGYYEIVDEKAQKIRFIDYEDSVLEHMLKITDYLDRNIDREDGTNCLKILRGDWNDAIDGLGATNDEGKQFGTGVSVMSTLQLYQNLREMGEILNKIGKYPEKAEYYLKVREDVRDGLNKYAVETNGNGEIRLIHGWGDHRAYKIGSFCDSDGVSRLSFAPFAFWAISGMIERDPQMRDTVINGLHGLNSEFGILTNTPAFSPSTPGVGRICRTLKGSAENECAYTHASMFGVLALFLVGDSEYAWKQLEKTLVISQKEPSKSPFVMSNSYCVNPEEGLNGHSAIDWYTGTGTVMMKNFVRALFGIVPCLEGLTIKTSSYMPCENAEISILVKGCKIRLVYLNKNNGKREIFINGKKSDSTYDELIRTEKTFIPNDLIHNDLEILVTD
ncbi:MAG: hypothetical protein J6J30_03880 [Clostridia bacterium]|nr:hypothetical protein [Clostridia bacterium]